MNCGLGLITVGLCRFIGCDKYTPLVSVWTVGEAVHVWGRGVCGYRDFCISMQFCCDPKTALKKNEVFILQREVWYYGLDTPLCSTCVIFLLGLK